MQLFSVSNLPQCCHALRWKKHYIVMYSGGSKSRVSGHCPFVKKRKEWNVSGERRHCCAITFFFRLFRKAEHWAFCKWQRQSKFFMISISRKALKGPQLMLLEHGVSFELLLCQEFSQMMNIMKSYCISEACLLFSLFSALFLRPWKLLWPFPMMIHPMGHSCRKISSHYAEF